MNYTFIYIILGLLLAGAITWVLIIIFRDESEPKGDTLWDSRLVPRITQGYTKLSQIDTRIGKSGRLLVTARALDIDPDRIEKEHLKLPVIIKFAIPSELVDSFSKGDSSRDKHEKIAMPRHAKDIPPKIRETKFGIAYAEAIESKNRQRAIEEIMTKDNAAQTKIAQMLSHDHLLSEFQKVMENIQKMNAEAIKDKNKPVTSSYPHVESHHQNN